MLIEISVHNATGRITSQYVNPGDIAEIVPPHRMNAPTHLVMRDGSRIQSLTPADVIARRANEAEKRAVSELVNEVADRIARKVLAAIEASVTPLLPEDPNA